MKNKLVRLWLGHPPATLLDSKLVYETAEQQYRRVSERFPGSGLATVAHELQRLAKDVGSMSRKISRPNWPFRLTVAFVSVFGVAAFVGMLSMAHVRDDLGGISDYVQGIQAMAQMLAYVGAIIYFLFGIELRRKRALVLHALNELRSFAHVIDMHQLSKTPEQLVMGGQKTKSSPERTLTQFELTRYLSYCSEMLSIVGKLAAIYVQGFADAAAVDAASDVEELIFAMSEKIDAKHSIIARNVKVNKLPLHHGTGSVFFGSSA